MRRDAADAERGEAVRAAAQDWLRAGWIDDEAFRAIEQIFPDDRVRARLAFRILFFVMTLGGITSLACIVYLQLRSASAAGTFALLAGAGCAATTHYLLYDRKRRQGGIEAAFSFAAVANLILGAAILLYETHWFPDQDAILLVWIIVCAISSCAAWLWGYWPYAALSALSLFSAIVALRGGRLIWIFLVAALYPGIVVAWESAELPPSLRKSAAAFLAVCILTLYAAENVYLSDQKISHFTTGGGGWSEWFHPRWLSIGLTATIPPAILLTGVIKRRRLFLNMGLLLVILSLITLRMYVHLAAPWVVLTGAGFLVFAFAAWLRSLLESGSRRERAGFTADPLSTDPGRKSAFEIAVTVSAMTPGQQAVTEKPSYRGGGGEFGGGGASGDF